MPYVKPEIRERLRIFNNPRTEGELNYLLTLEYIKYIQEVGESYTNYGKLITAINLLFQDLVLFNYGLIRPKKKTGIQARLHDICKNYFIVNKKSLENDDIFTDILGALSNSKDELYRRKIGPYEDLKIKQFGDVY